MAFQDCFARREPREHFSRYMGGQFSALERKSIEPMALEVEGGNIRAMQLLIPRCQGRERQGKLFNGKTNSIPRLFFQQAEDLTTGLGD